MSCPPEKAGPLPRRIATRTSGSPPMARKQLVSSVSMARESGLRRSGRLRVTIAVCPSFSSRIFSWPMFLPSLMDALRMIAPLALAQGELLHLAGGRLRERPELDLLRCLEVGKHGLAVRDDLLGRRVLARGEGDERLRYLAPLLVRHGDHGGFEHRRMAHHRLLDLDGADVLAAGDDDVLLAVAQLDGAVGMAHAEIAAVEPASVEGLRGGIGIAEIAEHHHVP